jgi:hypothetical protein
MPDAALREAMIPHLRTTAEDVPAPRLLLEGFDWRIVRMTNPENGEEKDVVEFADGRDALGIIRWTSVGHRDGVSTYMRVIRALTDQLTKGIT